MLDPSSYSSQNCPKLKFFSLQIDPLSKVYVPPIAVFCAYVFLYGCPTFDTSKTEHRSGPIKTHDNKTWSKLHINSCYLDPCQTSLRR